MGSSMVMLVLILTFTVAHSQQADHPMKMPDTEKSATLMSGLGSLHHPVSTINAEAQRFFDQGLGFIYAFNHDEAVRSFKQAADLDPKMAMAHWGIALALGPNINLDVDPGREQAAYDAVQKALSLSAQAPENEDAYIEALAKRYSADPKADLKKLAIDYKNAMGELVKRYPDDLDAATLYAESAMDLHPWQLWASDGKPAEGTEEIVATLESVLRRNPNHVGAIHYYIHAVEASPNPERALAYAPKLPTLMPAAGHLVHMPAHIYERTGDYGSAARSNVEAAKADEAYIKASGLQGVYPMMYYSHNLHFLAVANSMAGRYADAIDAAQKLEAHVRPYVKNMPMAEGFVPTPMLIMVRFHKWDEIRTLPQPDASLVLTNTVWHFARGMAYATIGNVEKAAIERDALSHAVKSIPPEAAFGLNPAGKILSIAENVLSARIAAAKRDNKTALALLRKAVEIEDSLAYDEPPAWPMPVRESLGGALMTSGDYVAAEQVFREDLQRNQRNGRSLFGLMESLKAQKKDYPAMMVQREFENAWKNADTKLTVPDLWR